MTVVLFAIIMVFLSALACAYFLIFQLLGRTFKKAIPKVPIAEAYHPARVTIIIACRDEAKNLPALFQSLASLSYNSRLLELIFVDDHSTDGSIQLAQSLAAAVKYKCDIIPNSSPQGKKAALKSGVSKASGEYLLFTDADCTINPDWVQGMMGKMTSQTKMVCGPVMYPSINNFFSRWVQLEFVGLVASGAALIQKGFPILANGANLAIEKETHLGLMEKVDGRDHLSGDDIFLLHALQKQNPGSIAFSFDKRAMVTTVAPENFSTFFNQRIRWGSKAKHYKSKSAIMISVFILTFHTCLLVLPFFAGSQKIFQILLLAFLSAKLLADYTFFRKTLSFFGVRRNILELILSSVVHTFYIVIIGWWSVFGSFRWKDSDTRKMEI
jgi:glycosyltransferase involved in cell wall biosynthesis